MWKSASGLLRTEMMRMRPPTQAFIESVPRTLPATNTNMTCVHQPDTSQCSIPHCVHRGQLDMDATEAGSPRLTQERNALLDSDTTPTTYERPMRRRLPLFTPVMQRPGVIAILDMCAAVQARHREQEEAREEAESGCFSSFALLQTSLRRIACHQSLRNDGRLTALFPNIPLCDAVST